MYYKTLLYLNCNNRDYYWFYQIYNLRFYELTVCWLNLLTYLKPIKLHLYYNAEKGFEIKIFIYSNMFSLDPFSFVPNHFSLLLQ